MYLSSLKKTRIRRKKSNVGNQVENIYIYIFCVVWKVYDNTRYYTKDKNEIKQKMRSIRFEQLKYEDVWKISTISNHFLIRRNKKKVQKNESQNQYSNPHFILLTLNRGSILLQTWIDPWKNIVHHPSTSFTETKQYSTDKNCYFRHSPACIFLGPSLEAKRKKNYSWKLKIKN